jgi:prepilin-type N-terminal cleavage/methylation domain-containing protein
MIARLRRNERGLTMVELMVALGILGILLTMISTLGVRMFRSSTQVVTSTQSEGAYQNAMRRITRQLRYAAAYSSSTLAFDTVDNTQVIFYTYSLLNGLSTVAPNKVRIWVDTNGVMWETVTAPSVSNGATVYTSTPITTQLATKVTNTVGAPAFLFYDSAALTGANVVPNGSGMTFAQLKSLKRVSVTLQSTVTSTLGVQQTVVFQNLLG